MSSGASTLRGRDKDIFKTLSGDVWLAVASLKKEIQKLENNLIVDTM